MQTAKGVRDIVPAEKILKNKIVETIRKKFELYGFLPLETPLVERYETLSAKFAAGQDSDALKEIFKLDDQGGRKLGLRFDLTVPLARYVAMNPTLKMPFKRYEVGPVFRDGPIKAGRMRQFWQCDADIIGSRSMLAEAELLSLIQDVFKELKLDVVIKVNNRKLLNSILEKAGVSKKEEAIIAIDKLDKIGKEEVAKELKDRGLKPKQIKEVLSMIDKNAKLKEIKLQSEGVDEMKELFKYLKQMKVKAVFDISLARGLAYYTGTVYEVFAKKGISSSLAAGGRYDDMIGNFMGKRDVPAVGISFGLVPMMECLKAEEVGSSKVYVIPINTLDESLAVVKELRQNDINTDLAIGKSVSKGLQYANSLKIPYAIIIGEDEVKKKKVLLRDMSTGMEQLISLKEAVKRLK